jgi:hypothetical protein
MGDIDIITKNGEAFVVDWDVIERLLKSVYTTQYQLIDSQINPMKSSVFNPRMDTLWTVDVDWDAVKTKTERDVRLEMPDLRSRAKVDPAAVARELDHRIEFAAGLRQNFLDKLKWVSTRNVQNIDKAVAAYDADIKIAKFVRDAAADVFMVAASIETGGAAATIYAGIGSGGKGYAKYQDTGSKGAAVMEGVGSFVFSVAKIAKPFGFSFSGGTTSGAVLVIVQAPYKTATELVSGKSFSEAAVAGLVKLTGPWLDQFFNKHAETALDMFANCALPLEITTTTGKDVAASFLSKATSKLTQQVTKEGAKAMIKAVSSTATATLDPPAPLIDEATLTNKAFLYHGLYNVNKGPGGGW